MARDDLPLGLSGAYRALTYRDDRDALERLTTLVWLRQLTDPAMPRCGGHDPRTVLADPLSWDELVVMEPLPEVLDLFCGRLNEVMGDTLLTVDWTTQDEPTVREAVREVGRWRGESNGGDALGYVSQAVTSGSRKSGLGAFYTPYEVSLMMAKMAAPGPGARVLDPCCGSGGMLLAALEACRSVHGPDQVPEVFGIDIDASAVRLCRMNLALAGIAPAGRVDCRDALAAPYVEEEATPLRRMVEASGGVEQLTLGL